VYGGLGNSENKSSVTYRVDRVIDASNLMCPGPILMLSTSISDLPQGSVVMVITRDPAFEEDLKSWSTYTGHEILDIVKGSDRVIAYIRKAR
jgi:TusA-related sulfurtransferase